MTKRTPPRKPGRVRWWAWLLIAAFVAYTASYGMLRATGDLYLMTVPPGSVWSGDVLVVDEMPALSRPTTWKRQLFAPCAAVEELWRNR